MLIGDLNYVEILTSAGYSYSQLGRESTDKETGLHDIYCPLGTLGRTKTCDQALKSMLVLLNKVGPGLFSGPAARWQRDCGVHTTFSTCPG